MFRIKNFFGCYTDHSVDERTEIPVVEYSRTNSLPRLYSFENPLKSISFSDEEYKPVFIVPENKSPTSKVSEGSPKVNSTSNLEIDFSKVVPQSPKIVEHFLKINEVVEVIENFENKNDF